MKNKWSREDLCDIPGRWSPRWWATSGAQPQIVTPSLVHKRIPKRQYPEYYLAIIVSILFSKNFTFWRESSSPSPLVQLRWFSLGIADQNRRPKIANFHPSGGTSQDSPFDCFEKDLDIASAMLNELLPAYTCDQWWLCIRIRAWSPFDSSIYCFWPWRQMQDGQGSFSWLNGPGTWAKRSWAKDAHGARRICQEIIGRHPSQVCIYFK